MLVQIDQVIQHGPCHAQTQVCLAVSSVTVFTFAGLMVLLDLKGYRELIIKHVFSSACQMYFHKRPFKTQVENMSQWSKNWTKKLQNGTKKGFFSFSHLNFKSRRHEVLFCYKRRVKASVGSENLRHNRMHMLLFLLAKHAKCVDCGSWVHMSCLQ